jgi:hypothetical protein
MQRRMQSIGRFALAGLVVVALGFGVTQVAAGAPEVMDPCSLCDWPQGQWECDQCCKNEGFGYGVCFPSGSCLCSY